MLDIVAAPAPRLGAVLEPGECGVFRAAPPHEAAEAVQGGEVVAAGLGADARLAVVVDEVDCPGVAVQLEVEEDLGMPPA